MITINFPPDNKTKVQEKLDQHLLEACGPSCNEVFKKCLLLFLNSKIYHQMLCQALFTEHKQIEEALLWDKMKDLWCCSITKVCISWCGRPAPNMWDCRSQWKENGVLVQQPKNCFLQTMAAKGHTWFLFEEMLRRTRHIMNHLVEGLEVDKHVLRWLVHWHGVDDLPESPRKVLVRGHSLMPSERSKGCSTALLKILVWSVPKKETRVLRS